MAIRCKTCGQSNPDGVRFCGECGTQLVFDSDTTRPDVEKDTEYRQGFPQGYQNQALGQGGYPPPGQGSYPGQGQWSHPQGPYPGQGQGPYPGQGQYGNQGYYGTGAGQNPGYQGSAYHSGPYPNGPYPGGAQGPNYGYGGYGYGYNPEWPVRSRVVAALLAIFAGGLGLHKFYLGRTVQGIFYLIFCWTLIPSMIAFFEGIGYLISTDEAFSRRYMVRVEPLR